MNNYTYEEIEIGLTESFSVTVTEEMQDSFRAMTGDINPLHSSEEFAKAKGYDGIVVFGMLTASLYSTLAGVYLPGEKSLVHSCETKFMKPVYIGDTLTVEGKVDEKNDTYGLIRIKAVIKNQNGVKVSKASIQVGLI